MLPLQTMKLNADLSDRYLSKLLPAYSISKRGMWHKASSIKLNTMETHSWLISMDTFWAIPSRSPAGLTRLTTSFRFLCIGCASCEEDTTKANCSPSPYQTTLMSLSQTRTSIAISTPHPRPTKTASSGHKMSHQHSECAILKNSLANTSFSLTMSSPLVPLSKLATTHSNPYLT